MKFHQILSVAAVSSLAAFAPVAASAVPVTIDFDALAPGSFTGPAMEDGFTVSGVDASVIPLASLISGFSAPNYIGPDQTSSSSSVNAFLTFTETDATTFEFVSLDADAGSAAPNGSVTVRGFVGAALVGTDMFAPTLSGGAETFAASNLAGLALTSLEIEALHIFGGTNSSSTFIDNVALETDANPIPVPAPLALLLGGIAAMGALKLRRKA